MTDFGDFDQDDALEELPDLSDEEWEQVTELQKRFDEVLQIADDWERKKAAKTLVREMNGAE